MINDNIKITLDSNTPSSTSINTITNTTVNSTNFNPNNQAVGNNLPEQVNYSLPYPVYFVYIDKVSAWWGH